MPVENIMKENIHVASAFYINAEITPKYLFASVNICPMR